MDKYNVQNGRWRETEQEITTIKRIIYTQNKKWKKEYKGGKSQASPPHQTKNQKRRKSKLLHHQKTKTKKIKKLSVSFSNQITNQQTLRTKKWKKQQLNKKQLHQQENQEISNQPKQTALRAATAVNFTTNYKKKNFNVSLLNKKLNSGKDCKKQQQKKRTGPACEAWR